MSNITKALFFTVVSITGLLQLTGCGSSTTDGILEKSSVALTALENNIVTYNTKSGTLIDEKYCPGGELRDRSDVVIGSWSVNGNSLSLNTGVTYLTTNGLLEKGVTYSTNSSETFTVITIADTVCF